jgi:hypothetical protein
VALVPDGIDYGIRDFYQSYDSKTGERIVWADIGSSKPAGLIRIRESRQHIWTQDSSLPKGVAMSLHEWTPARPPNREPDLQVVPKPPLDPDALKAAQQVADLIRNRALNADANDQLGALNLAVEAAIDSYEAARFPPKPNAPSVTTGLQLPPNADIYAGLVMPKNMQPLQPNDRLRIASIEEMQNVDIGKPGPIQPLRASSAELKAASQSKPVERTFYMLLLYQTGYAIRFGSEHEIFAQYRVAEAEIKAGYKAGTNHLVVAARYGSDGALLECYTRLGDL